MIKSVFTCVSMLDFFGVKEKELVKNTEDLIAFDICEMNLTTD